MTILKLILPVSLLFFSISSRGDGFLRGSLGYSYSGQDNGYGEVKTTRTIMDFTGGYIYPKGWALIGQYAMEKKSVASGGSTTESNRTSMGPGLGWISRQSVGPYITGVYYLSSEFVQPGLTYKGTGYQIDFGLKVQIQKVFLTGGLAYAHFEYTKTATGSLTPTSKETLIDPRLGLQFEF